VRPTHNQTIPDRGLVNKTDLDKAAKEQISVVTAGDLPKLLDAVPLMKGNDEILEIIQRFVPSTL
jgi:septum formation topological specificity factor MinE